MIKFNNTEVSGWKAAIRGMRNPLNSWSKSDSTFDEYGGVTIGENDLRLMKNLVRSGSDHAKFMRYLVVDVDITGPEYWWMQMDQYKVGTVTNSTSKMHKIQAKEFTPDDFSTDHMTADSYELLLETIKLLNKHREAFNETGSKEEWWQMIQPLPMAFNQTRTVHLNYAVLKNIYHARKNHKLTEWSSFCDWVETLPYKELITE